MAVIQTGRGVPYMRQIIVEGQTLDVKDGTTYLELAKNFQKKFDHDIVLVLENNKMRELFRKVKDGATVTFLTTGQIDGYNTYRRSATLLLLKAIYDVEGMEAVRWHESGVLCQRGLLCEQQKDAGRPGNARPDRNADERTGK